MVLADVREVRQRIPEPGSVRPLQARVAADRAGQAVGRRAALDIRRPRHAVAVQQVREVGPPVERAVRVAAQRRARPVAWPVEIRGARARRVRIAAPGRPARNEPEVRRQAPTPVRLEHVVLEDEVPRVGPVVRDLAAVVVAHDVRVPETDARRAVRLAEALADELTVGDADEAVHASAVDIALPGERAVRAARVVGAVRVEERPHAAADSVRHAHRRPAVFPRDPVGARVGAEEGIEGAVLLHDHDHVADLVDVAAAACVSRGGAAATAPRRREGEREDG